MSEENEPKQKKLVILEKSQFNELKDALGQSGEITTEESLKAENEDLKEKLSMIAERELTKRMQAKGLDPSNFDLKSAEGSQRAIDALHEKEQGTASIYSQYEHRPVSSNQAFEGSTKEEALESMVTTLKREARDVKDPVRAAEAQAVLDELWRKYGKSLRDNIESPNLGTNRPIQHEDKSKKTIKDYQRGA